MGEVIYTLSLVGTEEGWPFRYYGRVVRTETDGNYGSRLAVDSNAFATQWGARRWARRVAKRDSRRRQQAVREWTVPLKVRP